MPTGSSKFLDKRDGKRKLNFSSDHYVVLTDKSLEECNLTKQNISTEKENSGYEPNSNDIDPGNTGNITIGAGIWPK